MNTNIILLINSILIFIFILLQFISKFAKKTPGDNILIPITPETKKSDMILINEAIEQAIYKSLHFFVLKDFKFSDKCKVTLFKSGRYRDLINYLLRPDIFITENINGDIRDISFFDYFFQRVYLSYICETSNNIKSLLFKYISGKTIDNYNNPKAKP